MAERQGICLSCHQPFPIGERRCLNCGRAVDGWREISPAQPPMPREAVGRFELKRLCRTHGVYFSGTTIACPLCVGEKMGDSRKSRELLEARQETAEDKKKARNRRKKEDPPAIFPHGRGVIK